MQLKYILLFFCFFTIVHKSYANDLFQPNAQPSMRLDSVNNAIDALFILEQAVQEAVKLKGVLSCAAISDYKKMIAPLKNVDSLQSFSYSFGYTFKPLALVNSNIATYEAKYEANSHTILIYEIERCHEITPGYGVITDPSRYWNGFQKGFNLGGQCEKKMKAIEEVFLASLRENRDNDAWRKKEISKIKADEDKVKKNIVTENDKVQKQLDDFTANKSPAIQTASLTWTEGDRICLFTWNGSYEMPSGAIAFVERYNDTKTKAKIQIHKSGSSVARSYQGLELKEHDYIWIDIPMPISANRNGTLVTFYYWGKCQ